VKPRAHITRPTAERDRLTPKRRSISSLIRPSVQGPFAVCRCVHAASGGRVAMEAYYITPLSTGHARLPELHNTGAASVLASILDFMRWAGIVHTPLSMSTSGHRARRVSLVREAVSTRKRRA
jgi:hypothetical protein